MSQTYQICEATVTLPSLGTITTDGPGNQIKHGDKCRVHLYAVKPDWHSGTIFEGFNVGAICFTGYTDSPFKRSQKIMMPDGFKLVALRVDDDGVPTSWESLPVQFSGGLISLNDADGAIRARIGKIDGAEPLIKDTAIGNSIVSATYSVNLNINNNGKQHAAGMAIEVEDGQSTVEFMADRYTVHETASSIIKNAAATSAKTKIRLRDEMKQAIIDAVRESDLFASLKANIDAQTASVAGLQQAVSEAATNTIKNALKPGGLLYNR
ncbi:phage tail tip fiber protein [Enterobacter cloacae complex sp. IR5403]|uniref:phage tail tip fiber protein n=1 Tax=Enterobacter cloacae complex sp. IR5403 TaxID=3412359 RepID=UPI003BA3EBAD